MRPLIIDPPGGVASTTEHEHDGTEFSVETLASREVFDQLTEAIEQAEDLFVGRFRTAAAEVPVADVRLIYGKWDGSWGFTVSVRNSEQRVPIDKVSMQMRQMVVTHLDELWEACELAEAGRMRELNAAIGVALDFVRRHS